MRRCTQPQPACAHGRYGAVIDCVYAREAPAVVNDPASAELVASAARKICVSDGAVSIDRPTESTAHAAAHSGSVRLSATRAGVCAVGYKVSADQPTMAAEDVSFFLNKVSAGSVPHLRRDSIAALRPPA